MDAQILDVMTNHLEATSRTYAYGLDQYVIMHIKKRPRVIPKPVWYWLVGRVLNMKQFRVPRYDPFW